MNKTQQELYEKLLKKVNEFCLGQTAEDVIAAIDALVENYETPKVDSIIKNEYYLGTEKVSQQVYETIQMYKQMLSAYESRSSTNMDLDDALKVIYDSQDIMGGHDDFWKAYRTIETALKRLESVDRVGEMFCVNVDKKLKALEIIKNKKVNVRALLKSYYSPKDGLAVYNSQCCDWQEMESKELTQEEYELLKEILKWNH